MILPLSFEHLQQIAGIEQQVNLTSWSLEQLHSSLMSGHSGVVFFQEQVLGYALISTVLDEAELLLMGVRPRQQRQGVGSALMQALQKHLKQGGVKRFFLEVRESNEQAIAFYKKHGFVEHHRRKHYYGSEDAVVMESDFSSVLTLF